MLEEIETTVAALEPEQVDAGAVELLRAYARELDGAAAWRARADKLAKAAALRDPESALAEEAEALRAKLSERTALVQVGRELHKLLAELQATPKSRGGVKRPASGPSDLARLRAVK